VREAQANCTLARPSGPTAPQDISVRVVLEDGVDKTITTTTANGKTTIVTEWDKPADTHHKIVDERWPDGTRNVSETVTNPNWIYTNVTTSDPTPITVTTITNKTINIFPEVLVKNVTTSGPQGRTEDDSTIRNDGRTKTTVTDKATPDGKNVHKVIVEADGTTTTTTTTDYVDP
jgi:hypothetical protein